MAKPSQLDRAIADLNEKIVAADTARSRAIASADMELSALCNVRDALLATKQATAKIKGASKRKPTAPIITDAYGHVIS